MAKMSGRITLVQESRFVLTDPEGVSHLFTLSPHAGAEPSQLQPLAARQAKAEVTYGEVRNMITSLATRIDLIDETAAEPAP